jgi:phenylacetic acid degradation operon negative regulatory protein
MAEVRLAEHREGVWLRPDNLGPPRQLVVTRQCTLWSAEAGSDIDGRALVAQLWDLDAWAKRARALTEAFGPAGSMAERFMVGAATLHHLLGDPLLPDGLAPPGWPAAELRQRFASFYEDLQTELAAFLRG